MTLWDLVAKLVDLADRRCNFTAYLVIVMTVGAFALTSIVIFHEVPESARSAMFGFIGAIWGSVGTIVTFKFGSSAQGQKKTDAIIEKLKQ